MADKTIGELSPVTELNDNSLLVAEQDGEAVSVSGALLKQYIANAAGGTGSGTGSDGDDGVSPTVEVTEIDGGHRVSITDVNGTQTFDVMDGERGESGVYVGSGDMPEGYNVQIDPSGEAEPFPVAAVVSALPEATEDMRGTFLLLPEDGTDVIYICTLVAGVYKWINLSTGGSSGGDSSDDSTTSVLGVAVLGNMILGG